MILDRAEAEKMSFVSNKTFAIYDPAFTSALAEIPWADWVRSPNPFRCREEFLDFYPRWIASSRKNSVKGLEQFSNKHLINGTTQTFDEVYFKYADKRLRLFRGEYAYHRRVAKKWLFIEDEPLAKGDYLIISAPFCSTGDVHPQMSEVLKECENLQLPVVIDCAYFGTCHNFHLDVSSPSIESVNFSLTKGLGVGDMRSGIRFSNIKDTNPICQHNDYNHTVLLAAKIGIYMMSKFSPDYIADRYADFQQEVCAMMPGLQPTNCMHLALGDETWSPYKVDGKYNRVGIRELIRARRQGRLQ